MLTNFACTKRDFKKIESSQIKEFIDKKSTYVWINAKNLNQEESNLLKEIFDIHPTTIEDMFSQQTHIKYEEFEEYTLIIFKSIKGIKENYIET